LKLEREQKRRGKIKGKEGNRGRSTEKRAETSYATTIGMAEEAIVPSAGNNRACSDGGSQEDECSSSERIGGRIGDGSSSKMGLLCDGSRQREELLCLQGFWAHGLSLQE